MEKITIVKPMGDKSLQSQCTLLWWRKRHTTAICHVQNDEQQSEPMLLVSPSRLFFKYIVIQSQGLHYTRRR